MKYLVIFVVLSFFFLSCEAQVKIIVDKIPQNTSDNAKIYLAGNFNSWNPADEKYLLQKNDSGQFEINWPQNQTSIEFKFTLGSWDWVELDSLNQDIPNRKLTLGSQTSFLLNIQAWKKPGIVSSTASPNVKILKEDFEMPQLNRTRRIWIYLPPDYENTQKKYPVLYAHDGQNLFDAATSYAGEWGLDESLDQILADTKNAAIIVVGIDNGQQHRMDEYAPWTHPEYGGGEGAAYIDFIVHTLKPYIDQNFRTKADRKYTGIIGSSMGGLISFYAALKYPEVFDKVGVLSPSFWFSEEIFEMAANFHSKYQPKFYFLVGGKEGSIMTDKMTEMYQLLQSKKYPSNRMFYSLIPEGEHKEVFWNKEFYKVYDFLFDSIIPAK